MPGAVAIEITSNSGVSLDVSDPDRASRFPTPSAEDAATIILDGIERGAFHIHVGRDSPLMGILGRLAPKRATHLIQRQRKALLD
jgi:hypothetical protein